MNSAFPTQVLSPVEEMSLDELQSLQLKRLQWTLQHAYENVPMYRKKFNDAGVHPADLKECSDLAQFPYTSKQDLRDNYPFNSFAVPMDKVLRIHASSGTTGQPTVVGYTQHDIDYWADLVARSIRVAGGKPGDKVQVAYGYGLFTGGLGAHYGAERLGCTVIPMSGGQTAKQVQLIRDFQPDILMVTPSYCLNIADEFVRQGLDPRESSLRLGIFGAEPWTNAMRLEIEERMGLQAADIYGLSEVMGPGVAQEFLSTKDGPTIWEDCFYPEIIHPQSLQTLDDGAEGELVFTSLIKEAMPIIRYRTRDLTKLLPGSACVMRRMEKITGRSDDMLIIRGVNVFPSQIEEQILQIDALSPHYQIQVSREGHLDQMSLAVEARHALSADVLQQAGSQLQRNIKEVIGISVLVDIKPMGAVERSQGKAKRVLDSRT